MDHDTFPTWQQHLDSVTRSEAGPRTLTSSGAPGLTLLAHPDLRRLGETAMLNELVSGAQASLSRRLPLFSQPGDGQRRPLGDPHLSRRPVYLAVHEGTVEVDLSHTRTRVSVDGQPVDGRLQLPWEALDTGVVLTLADRVALLLHILDPLASHGLAHHGLVGESRGLIEVRRQIERVADLEVSVLLRGETGTGKELVARAIHQASKRRDEPFVAINMGAVPPSLAAAELFGATKGAFTGADRKRRGFFERADGGTLFLDEIGDTPSEVQVLLLRTLETGRIQPVGGGSEQEVDVRIIAATDAALETAIAEQRFRAPLLHRLSGYSIHLPALRQRRSDIGRLLLHFLTQELAELGESWRLDAPVDQPRAWLPAMLMSELVRFPWPGNVRQLRNVVRQLAVASRGEPVLRVPAEVRQLLDSTPGPSTTGSPLGMTPHPAGSAKPADPISGPGSSPRKTPSPPLEEAQDDSDLEVSTRDEGSPPLDPVENLEDTPVTQDPSTRDPDLQSDLAESVSPAPRYRDPREVGNDELLAALRDHAFRILPTAKALGVSRGSLYNLIDAAPNVRKAIDLSADEIETCRAETGGDLDAMAAQLEVSRKGLSRRMRELGLSKPTS